jgi:hypothetical protein
MNLNLILQFCLILLIIALTVVVVMAIIMMVDVIFITRRLKKEIKAVTFLIDILDLIVGGVHLAKKKIAGSGFMKGLKKTLRVVKEDE